MKLFKGSILGRIVVNQIVLVLVATIIIGLVTYFQFKDEARHYQTDKLERRVASIEASINYQIESTSYPVDTEHISLIFKDKIYEISHIHDTQIIFYDLEGKLLRTSRATFFKSPDNLQLDGEIIDGLKNTAHNHYHYRYTDETGKRYQASFSYVTDRHFKPLAILALPSLEDDGFLEKELRDFLFILGNLYVLIIFGTIVFSYFFSRNITRSLDALSEKIAQTRVDQKNQKIQVKDIPLELEGVIDSYNEMVDELEESAAKLATSEREQAWREMAKQVAHEVKNPLTPMRLNMQRFERNFDPDDPESREKVKAFSKSMIQQIDTMSAVASAFSDFANMPKSQRELLNIPEVIKMALDIYKEETIIFSASSEEILAQFDRSQLIRVVTNLVKNANQASEHLENPEIRVSVTEDEANVFISIKDNGKGISDEDKNRIFEPKFTTKSGGMGLGLSIIKKIIETHKGKIYFESVPGQGTTFFVEFPKNN